MYFFLPLLRYFDDGKELVVQIQEKQKELPDDLGEDFSKAESFHRMHAAFERDISALGKQVESQPGFFYFYYNERHIFRELHTSVTDGEKTSCKS